VPVHKEKKAKYANLGARLAASKARATARHQGVIEEESPKKEKSNGATAAAKPARRKATQTSKLTKEQKNPKLTREPDSSVDQCFRDTLGDNKVDPNTGLSAFQIALVERIRDREEIGVLELCYLLWEKEELAQAKQNGKDLTRIVRNALRSPKAAGIIAHSSTRGNYVFVEWRVAGRRGK